MYIRTYIHVHTYVHTYVCMYREESRSIERGKKEDRGYKRGGIERGKKEDRGYKSEWKTPSMEGEWKGRDTWKMIIKNALALCPWIIRIARSAIGADIDGRGKQRQHQISH